MSASKRSSSTEHATAAETDEADPPKPGEPVYRMLADAYGLKKGDQRTARGLYRQGVTPDYLIYRQFAELVKPHAHAADKDA